MIDEKQAEAIHRQLFARPDLNVYAVLDGASIPNLRERLFEDEPEHVCLFRGELAPDLAEAAPYLVKLQPDDRFTKWLIEEGWGQHWGIFAVSSADMRTVRTHFRGLLTVRDPEGKELHFRFYDPRVLRVFLPTCEGEQVGEVFGVVEACLCESEEAAVALGGEGCSPTPTYAVLHFAASGHTVAAKRLVPRAGPTSKTDNLAS